MTEWQPIETAPKDGRDILAYVGILSNDYAVVQWNGRCWDMLPGTNEVDEIFREFGSPTHWMPLPQPPET